MGTGAYQVLLLGSIDDGRCDQLKGELQKRITELGLPSDAVRLITSGEAHTRDIRSPLMGVFFGAPAHVGNTPLIDELLQNSVVIAPLASSLTQVKAEIPPQLYHVNVLASDSGDGIGRVATLVLETFRLLRRERRIFISYRRNDSQPFAEKLYDALDARGFDVFIDVRSVPPAVDFQSELWHRMSDSDVVVLIDTPGFRESRWTTEELAKANATNIQILHLLWPGQKEDAESSFSYFMELSRRDFRWFLPRRGQSVFGSTLVRICDEVERLRARAIAARYRYLVDNFCDAARDLGLSPAVQVERWISLENSSKSRRLAVVPAVGVPTSDRLNEIFDAVTEPQTDNRDIWIVYDNRGILNTWLDHLDWLDSHLPLRTVRMVKAPDLLRELTS